VCQTLHELVAIPQHVLGLHSDVYAHLLLKVWPLHACTLQGHPCKCCSYSLQRCQQGRTPLVRQQPSYVPIITAVHLVLLCCSQVCDKLVDIMPKRLAITPLLPSASSHPSALLAFSQASVRTQLQAHLASIMAAQFCQLKMAHGCSGGGATRVEDVVRGMLCGPEAQGCAKMLLRWQGSLDAARFQQALESVSCHWHHSQRQGGCAFSSVLRPGSSDHASCILVDDPHMPVTMTCCWPSMQLNHSMMFALLPLVQAAGLHLSGGPAAEQPERLVSCALHAHPQHSCRRLPAVTTDGP
jgi:hypothetical protein